MASLHIPISKGGASVTVDTDALPEAMYSLAMMEGLKVLLNKSMSKITVAKLEGEKLAEARAAAMEVAQKNFEKLMAGEFSTGRKSAASGKIPGVVMTEARRLAKEVIKNEIRAAGMKPSHVEASEITKLANELIANDPSYVEQAQANISARTAKVTSGEDAEAVKAAALAKLAKLGGVHESPKLVKAAADRKAESKTILSKTQAGKVAPRKGSAPSSHATH